MEFTSHEDRVQALDCGRLNQKPGSTICCGINSAYPSRCQGQQCRDRGGLPVIPSQPPLPYPGLDTVEAYCIGIPPRTRHFSSDFGINAFARLRGIWELLGRVVVHMSIAFLAFTQQITAPRLHLQYCCKLLDTCSTRYDEPRITLADQWQCSFKSAGSGQRSSTASHQRQGGQEDRGKAHTSTRRNDDKGKEKKYDDPQKDRDRENSSNGGSSQGTPSLYQPNSCKYPCPFRVRNPARFNYREHESCTRVYLFSDLKKHVRDYHNLPQKAELSTCQQCNKSPSLTRSQGTVSMHSPCCRPDPEDGITETRIPQLIKRGKDSILDWDRLWMFLFNQDAAIPPAIPIAVVEASEIVPHLCLGFGEAQLAKVLETELGARMPEESSKIIARLFHEHAMSLLNRCVASHAASPLNASSSKRSEPYLDKTQNNGQRQNGMGPATARPSPRLVRIVPKNNGTGSHTGFPSNYQASSPPPTESNPSPRYLCTPAPSPPGEARFGGIRHTAERAPVFFNTALGHAANDAEPSASGSGLHGWFTPKELEVVQKNNVGVPGAVPPPLEPSWHSSWGSKTSRHDGDQESNIAGSIGSQDSFMKEDSFINEEEDSFMNEDFFMNQYLNLQACDGDGIDSQYGK